MNIIHDVKYDPTPLGFYSKVVSGGVAIGYRFKLFGAFLSANYIPRNQLDNTVGASLTPIFNTFVDRVREGSISLIVALGFGGFELKLTTLWGFGVPEMRELIRKIQSGEIKKYSIPLNVKDLDQPKPHDPLPTAGIGPTEAGIKSTEW